VFQRFTAQARSVVVQARLEAGELGHRTIGTQHVLLAMVAQPDSTGGRVLRSLALGEDEIREDARRSGGPDPAGFSGEDAEALRSVGIDLDEVRRTVEETFGPGALDQEVSPVGDRWVGHVPFTRGAKKALELGLREAIRLGHGYLGTEHLLLGMVRDERCSGARILAAHGLALERVRAEVLREIAGGGERPGRTA
jgi:ATP-dependent Clp protease ATP-binding subunit ClpA